MKVLYCCAFAHYTGHYPSSALHETEALRDSGVNVMLLTFKGLVDGAELGVPHFRIDHESGWFGRLFVRKANILRRSKATRRLAMFLEWVMVLAKAMELRRELNIDVIHLRDGEPFPFLVHLFGCFNKGLKFLVSFTGTNLLFYNKTFNLGTLIYLSLLKIVNSSMWLPIYRRSMDRNSFVFTAQNAIVKDRFSYEFMDGILDGKVFLHPLWVNEGKVVDKIEARDKLLIRHDAFVFLIFGNVHVGKDITTPLRALKALTENGTDAIMLQAGDDTVLNTGSYFDSVKGEAEHYKVSDKVISHNWYIAENVKHLYFSASDVCVLAYHGSFASTASVLWEIVGFRKPIIASDIGDMGKLVRMYQLGLTYQPNDLESLADAMQSFIKTKGSKITYGFDEFNGDYSSKRWAKRCIELYKRL